MFGPIVRIGGLFEWVFGASILHNWMVGCFFNNEPKGVIGNLICILIEKCKVKFIISHIFLVKVMSYAFRIYFISLIEFFINYTNTVLK